MFGCACSQAVIVAIQDCFICTYYATYTGAFGKVYKGVYTKDGETIEVAIKTLRGSTAQICTNIMYLTRSMKDTVEPVNQDT